MTCIGFRLQPDWDQCYAENAKYIWFHEYDNVCTRYHRLQREGSKLIPDYEGVECELISPKLIQFSSNCLKKSFQSPDKSLRLIKCSDRVPNTHLSCFDVSPSGELILSALSNGSINVSLAQTGEVARTLDGHVGEVYTCRFFPSGLAALTGGADMQLKIWCLVTGACAATLAPRCAGVAQGIPSHIEPGGHRAGILDTAIVERGRNILAIDRLGWLRLWDVASQTCISALPVTDTANDVRLASAVVLEEITCIAIRKHSALPIVTDFERPCESWYKVLETTSNTATEVETSDKLVAVGTGSKGVVRIYELGQRYKGCIVQLSLPTATGAVESCSFIDDTTTSNGGQAEYGLFTGGQGGELVSWDLRYTGQPVWQLTGEKGAVHHLRAFQAPNKPYSCLIVGRSDGRILSYPFHLPAMVQSGTTAENLELTGINCEPIRGMAVGCSGDAVRLWSASYSGVAHHYQNLQISTAFCSS